jgi:hypothetical protein
LLERRPSRLARYRRPAVAATGAFLGGVVAFWLDRGLMGGGWGVPLTGLVAGGALFGVADTAVHWVGQRLKRAAEEAEAKPPFARLTPPPRDAKIDRPGRRPKR